MNCRVIYKNKIKEIEMIEIDKESISWPLGSPLQSGHFTLSVL